MTALFTGLIAALKSLADWLTQRAAAAQSAADRQAGADATKLAAAQAALEIKNAQADLAANRPDRAAVSDRLRSGRF